MNKEPLVYKTVEELADAFRRASSAHHAYERLRGGEPDKDWPMWYAFYLFGERMVKEDRR